MDMEEREFIIHAERRYVVVERGVVFLKLSSTCWPKNKNDVDRIVMDEANYRNRYTNQLTFMKEDEGPEDNDPEIVLLWPEEIPPDAGG